MWINALIDFLKEYGEFISVMVKRKLMEDPALRFIVSAMGPIRAEKPTFSFQKERAVFQKGIIFYKWRTAKLISDNLLQPIEELPKLAE